ncbi:MAG: histone deacetylase [Pelotomaculum sp.]|nr:histone deacetylase [Pelotomaculum sp.]
MEGIGLRTGLIYDAAYLNHETYGCPESPARVKHTYEILKIAGMLEKLVTIKPRPATVEEVSLVHLPAYIERVKEFSKRGGGSFGNNTTGSPETFETALLAAGGTLSAVEAVLEGRVESAFALVRPPGHHARPGQAMGYCFFNNAAIAARYAIKRYGLSRVLIIDWDEHHGNGTEEIFYSDPSVLYFSVHRDWSYPGTGQAAKAGDGEGKGFNINVPLPKRSGDADYEHVFRRILRPVALAYRPQLVLVSAGFDAHRDDLIGQMSLTPYGYMALTGIVCEIATCCGGALAAVLEGGYNPGALAESVFAVLHTMAGWDAGSSSQPADEKPVKVNVMGIIEEVVKIHGSYWDFGF